MNFSNISRVLRAQPHFYLGTLFLISKELKFLVSRIGYNDRKRSHLWVRHLDPLDHYCAFDKFCVYLVLFRDNRLLLSKPVAYKRPLTIGLKSRQNQCYKYTNDKFLVEAWCQIKQHKFIMGFTVPSRSGNLYPKLEYEFHASPYLLHALSILSSLILSGERYKLWNISVYKFLPYLLSFGSKHSPQHLFSSVLNPHFPLVRGTKFHTHINKVSCSLLAHILIFVFQGASWKYKGFCIEQKHAF